MAKQSTRAKARAPQLIISKPISALKHDAACEPSKSPLFSNAPPTSTTAAFRIAAARGNERRFV